MKSKPQPVPTTRREFLANTAAAVAAASPLSSEVIRAATAKMIGIQVGAVSFVDEGIDQALDILQDLGAVNTVCLTTFTYGRGLAGRQIPGRPFPDHGVQESDEKFFHGGNYAVPHAGFYARTSLKQTRAPDHGDLDIVAAVLPAARKRNLRLFCSVEDVWRTDVPGVREAAEVDLLGRRTATTCLLNPDVRAFWTALVTDLCRLCVSGDEARAGRRSGEVPDSSRDRHRDPDVGERQEGISAGHIRRDLGGPAGRCRRRHPVAQVL